MSKVTKSNILKKERDSTKIKKRLFIKNYFKITGNVSMLCKQINIARKTYYEWMEKDKKFKEVIEAEQEGLVDFTESKLFQLINDKNPTVIIFFLKTKGKHRGYVERQEFEHSGEVKLIISNNFLPRKGK